MVLLFSFYFLLRGFYYPGSDCIGGFVAYIACVIHSFANGTENTLNILRYNALSLIPIGLAILTVSATLPLLFCLPLMTGLWLEEPSPVIGMIGSALFFDIGVYLVVIGVVLTI